MNEPDVDNGFDTDDTYSLAGGDIDFGSNMELNDNAVESEFKLPEDKPYHPLMSFKFPKKELWNWKK